MPRVAVNADAYAATRVGIFFPANNSTPADGNLTGQCVTLIKWFMAEMSEVPNPFAARGDARYVGQRLVAEGLATEVPYDQRSPGDIVCLEYGVYGHIYLQLSGGRVFEENVNIGGVARKLVDGEYVYASRIGSDSEAWRAGKNAHVYRLKSYGGIMNPNTGDVDNIIGELWGRKPNPEDYGFTQGNWHDFIYGVLGAYPYTDRKADYADAVQKRAGYDTALGIAEIRSANFQRICDALAIERLPDENATTDKIIAKIKGMQEILSTIANLQMQIAALSQRPTQEELDALKKTAEDANAKAEALQNEKVEAEKTGNAFIRWIGDLFNKFRGGN